MQARTSWRLRSFQIKNGTAKQLHYHPEGKISRLACMTAPVLQAETLERFDPQYSWMFTRSKKI